ncbi:MAG: hypothetical protein ACXADU_01015 [Promethearchaeota archaeon]|jgi:hypothetical protein
MKSTFSFTELEKKIGSKSLIFLIGINILINLFFIQGLRGFFPALRIALFHVVFGEAVLENLFSLLALIFLFLPGLTNTICKKIDKRRLMISSIYIIVIVRLLWAFHVPVNLEIIYSGIIIAFYGFYLSTFLTLWSEGSDDTNINHKIVIIIFSVFSAFLIDYLIRTIGFSQDISLSAPGLILDWRITQFFWLIIQIPLTILCIYYTKTRFPRFSEVNNTSPQKMNATKDLRTFNSLIFAGIGIFFFLLFNLFLYPSGIGQFTDTNYFFNNVLNIISVMIVIYLLINVKIEVISNKYIIGILNGFMVLSLLLFLTIGKLLSYITSIFISISLVVMYINFYLLFIQLTKISFKWEKLKTISNGLTIGLAFMVLFSFLHAFTTEWAAIITAMKGLGPLIMILAGIVFSVSTIYATIIKSKEEILER